MQSITSQKHDPIALMPLLITAGLLLFGYGVLIIGIEAMHMRPDEQLTYQNMQFDFWQSMIILFTRNNQAPLWWVQIWGWQRTAGVTEFAGRINSILWAMVTLSLIYQMATTWFKARQYGWFALAVLSVNSYFFIYALEIRMYAMGMMTVALSMWLFGGWLRRRNTLSAVMYGLSIALMLYTHYFPGLIVIAQVLYFVIFHLRTWRMLRQGILVAVSGLIAWLPGLIILVNQLLFIAFAESGGLTVPTRPTNAETIFDLVQLSSNGLWWLYGLIILIGCVLLRRHKSFWLLLTWLIGFPAIVLLLNTQATVYNVRYTSFFSPAIGLTIGVIIAALPVARYQQWVKWLAVMLFCGVSLGQLPGYLPERIPFRTIFGDISARHQADDVWYGLPVDYFNFYDDQYQRYLPDTLLDNRVLSVEEARESRRIWFTTNRFLDEDIQAEFRALEATHRVWYVAEGSDCSGDYCYIAQLMLAPPLETASYFGGILGFAGADVHRLRNNQLEVILWWQVESIPQEDYSISLQLLREDGSLVTQIDRQIDPPGDEFGEIATSALLPGDSYIDERILTISPDLENGDYTLQVVVYQWWDGTRLTLPDGSDAYEIETITLNR